MSDTNYDLFVSYAHRDNHDGWVEAFVAEIQKEHLRFSPKPLKIFLDLRDIRTMNDWEHRILGGLRGSKLMLAMLTPHYFDSVYCRKEWEIYVQHELDKAMTGESIAPIYVVTAPFYEDESKAALDQWLGNLRRRQYVDVRPWREGGREALQLEEASQRLKLLEQQLSEKLDKAGRIAVSQTTIPPHNPNFVGRVDELRQLRETLAYGRVGAITAVHGLGGMGKRALAFEYAHAFADQYPGGRFLVPCAQVKDLRVPMVALAEYKSVVLTDEDRKDLAAAFTKVRAAFENGPRSLLLLDNIDDPALLSPSNRSQHLPSSDNVHVLATTRLESDCLTDLTCVAMDALPEADALALLGRYRLIETDEDWHAARAIVRRLGGHALATEVVAVYLWKTAEEGVTYSGYLQRLEGEGITSLNAAASDDRVELSRHQQKLIGELLAPTLVKLPEPELLAMKYAALLPPDVIALPWLKALVGQQFPQIARDPKPGYPDPWHQLTRRLKGLRLFTLGNDNHLVRMHRLTQEIIIGRLTDSEFENHKYELSLHITDRINLLLGCWFESEKRWEISPCTEYAMLLLDGQENHFGPWLANRTSLVLTELGDYAGARKLLESAIAVQEEISASKSTAEVLPNNYAQLALIELNESNWSRARKLLLKAIAIDEKSPATRAGALSIEYSNLGGIDHQLQNLPAARHWLLKAIGIQEKSPELRVHLAGTCCNLAMLELEEGNQAEARRLQTQAIEIEEELNPSTHPTLAKSYANLASIERADGNVDEAHRLLLKAIKIEESAFEHGHPALANHYSNLAHIEISRDNLQDSRLLFQKAIAIQEAIPSEKSALISSYAALASVERNLGNVLDARRLIHSVIEVLESWNRDDIELANFYSELAIIENQLRKPAEAKKQLTKAVAIEERLLPPDDPILCRDYSLLAMVELDTGNLQPARELLQKVIAMQRRAQNADPIALGRSYSNLSHVERAAQNLPESSRLLLLSITILESKLGDGHPSLAMKAFNLALAEHELGNSTAAKQYLLKAIACEKNAPEPNPSALGNDYSNLALVELSLSDLPSARNMMRLAHKIYLAHRYTQQLEASESWLVQHDPSWPN